MFQNSKIPVIPPKQLIQAFLVACRSKKFHVEHFWLLLDTKLVSRETISDIEDD
jgi:hypothetical protein